MTAPREALLCPESLKPNSECSLLFLVDPNDPETAPENVVAHLEEDHGYTAWEAILALQAAGETYTPKETS